MIFSRDAYINLLEKRAEDDSPNYSIDNQDVAIKEHESNRGDSRTQLRGLFTQAGAVESGNTRTMDKLLPHKPRETSNILMKVASASRELPFFKHASPAFFEATLRAFDRELLKIAVDPKAVATAGKTGLRHLLGGAPSAVTAAPKALDWVRKVPVHFPG